MALSACSYDARIDGGVILKPGRIALVSTIERFVFPHNLCGHVRDKSSLARRFVSVFNTHFDPGFTGHATIEIINYGYDEIVLLHGTPLCQFVFQWLDKTTELPYFGKYQNQQRGPQGARFEEAK